MGDRVGLRATAAMEYTRLQASYVHGSDFEVRSSVPCAMFSRRRRTAAPMKLPGVEENVVRRSTRAAHT